MLNLSLNNESPVQKLMMKHLVIDNIPGLLTLPEWIEGAAETLEALAISELPNFRMLPECLTTMTHLKKLGISGCPQLLSLPSGIHHLTALEFLRIKGCPELCRKCKPKSGEYWPMIAHIKTVIIEEEDDEEEEGRH
ncbi:disease resistance protein (CC-NBS-LRR class) family protein [Trifolium medium]|uniref:Disease resistance protein (CC-NBS-LRR class) family protein n=1 Tax=Trifolium medium TaxID=97028 RepID=A0A392QYR5_9FABA|nr:disease resistance protein (CC-NBS-LRR class) family protein [Trifolium medium]